MTKAEKQTILVRITVAEEKGDLINYRLSLPALAATLQEMEEEIETLRLEVQKANKRIFDLESAEPS